MNEQEKREYLEQYKKDKAKGVPFFPDIIFKDTVVMGAIFLILIGLIVFVGVPLEERANPADANYLPRPEWYFLWIFQLLKYFPGSLEVVATAVLPVVGILALLLLPFYDRGPKRHALHRPVASGLMSVILAGIVFLTYQSIATTPKSEAKAQLTGVNLAAQQYNQNCAACHGSSVVVRTGVDLNKIIAGGLSHEGMPAWGGNFTTEEIGTLVSYISSPDGGSLFQQNCAACHDLNLEVPGGADELRDIITAGPQGKPHQGQDVDDWYQTLDSKQINALVNFVLAPQPKKLYAFYCAGCHGSNINIPKMKESQLADIIRQGGKHRTMPAWQGTLSDEQITALAAYIAEPQNSLNKPGKDLFDEQCTTCHGDKLPADGSIETIQHTIARGGPHQTMPAWSQVLDDNQIEALVEFILTPPSGAEEGAKLFAANCVGCHGKYGEGGPNPARPGDIIHPISSGDFISTRTDETIHAIIAQGQPNLGMVPFSADNGGPLSDDQINQVVAFMRTWESKPPVIPEKAGQTPTPTVGGKEIFARACANCHGPNGEGNVGPPLNSKEFLAKYNNAEIRRIIKQGMSGSSMWAWGDLGLLHDDQIDDLVKYVRAWEPDAPSRAADWQEPNAGLGEAWEGEQFFGQFCSGCHGANGERQVSGVVLHDAQLLAGLSDEQIVHQILDGGKQMPAFHAIFSRHKANDILAYLRTWQPGYVPPTPLPAATPATEATAAPSAGGASFAQDVLPIFDAKCKTCHGAFGGWSAADYDSVTTSGQHAPVIVAGDPDTSLLVQKLQGTQTDGGPMPPGSKLTDDEINTIVSWVQAGAPNN